MTSGSTILARGTLTALTRTESLSANPSWSPDGSRLGFVEGGRLYVKTVGGSGDADLIWESERQIQLGDWSPDGDSLVLVRLGVETGFDLLRLTLASGEVVPFAEEAGNDIAPVFSPDGGFVAYTSNEGGRREVYVRAFPRGDRKLLVSTGGGDQPCGHGLETSFSIGMATE